MSPAYRRRKERWSRFIRAYRSITGCAVCGESDPDNLELHHLNPRTKRFQLGTGRGNHSRPWSQLLRELMKTETLCPKHHRQLHAGVIAL